jgi:hypothetical protein
VRETVWARDLRRYFHADPGHGGLVGLLATLVRHRVARLRVGDAGCGSATSPPRRAVRMPWFLTDADDFERHTDARLP